MEGTEEEYLDKLVEYSIVKLDAIASVVETKQTWAVKDNFQFIKPKIDIKVSMNISLLLIRVIILMIINSILNYNSKLHFRLKGSQQ